MQSGLSYAVCQFDWQIWSTLTFRHLPVSWDRAVRLYFAWERELSRRFRLHPVRGVKWVLRGELGEKHGRFHLHTVLTGWPKWALTDRTFGMAEALWRRQPNGGIAEVQRYVPSLDGATYLVKGLGGWNVHDARLYEAIKFGSADMVLFSHSCLREMERRARLEETWARSRRAGATGSVPESERDGCVEHTAKGSNETPLPCVG